jgi:SAM-dependent methyltransferase/acyl carrier protein
LREQARRLAAHLRRSGLAAERNRPDCLADVAFTLQTGREVMDERLAFVTADADALAEACEDFAAGREHGGWRGSAATSRRAALLDDDEARPLIDAWMRDGKLAKLAELWVGGGAFPWGNLHRGRDRRIVSLPSYPFARERHWYRAGAGASLVRPGVDAHDIWTGVRRGFKELRDIGRLLVLDACRELGAFHRAGEHYERAALSRTLSVAPRHARLFNAMLDFLARAGFVALDRDGVTVLNAATTTETLRALERIEARKRQAIAELPDMKGYVDLLWTCGRNLAAVLRGVVPATDVMFPGSSAALVEAVYQQNEVADFFNGIVARSVKEAFEAWLACADEGDTFRILEIGAGVGATTAAVLSAMARRHHRMTYDYSDISPAFTRRGEERFGTHPFMRFRVLDIEDEAAASTFASEPYDAIVATNVLHVASSVRRAVRNAKRLLAPQGRLVINEATAVHEFSVLTFGLLDGWWPAEDLDLRLVHSPLLGAPAWADLLRDTGLQDIEVAARPASEDPSLSQDVIAARNDGATAAVRPTVAQSAVRGPVHRTLFNGAADEHVLRRVCAAVGGVLRLPPESIDPDATYLDLGVDSILAIEIIGRINSALDVTLRSVDLFNYASAASLARHITALHTNGIRVPVEPTGDQEDPLLAILRGVYAGDIQQPDAKAVSRLIGGS